jgi:hypothetical protein
MNSERIEINRGISTLLKKTIYVFLSLMLIFVLTSCNKADEYKIIEPPEDGWTMELLESVFYINSVQTKPNFELSLLGDDFSFSIEEMTLNENNKIIGGGVNYKGKRAFTMGAHYNIKEDPKDNIFISESNMMILLCGEESNFSSLDLSKFIIINGVHIGSSQSELIDAMGNPENQNSPSTFSYDLSDTKGSVLFGLNKDTKKVDSIWITLVD